MEDFYSRHGVAHPVEQLKINESALAAKYGWHEAPYFPPAEGFYLSNYILDGCVAADLLSDYGYFRSSAKQLSSFRRSQLPSGMVPGVSHPPQNFTWNPERWLSTLPFHGNDYTQSPVWAYSVLKLYEAASDRVPADKTEAIDPDLFTEDIYPRLSRYYGDYFIKHRQVASNDPRVFIIHPHEANRDSGPEYDEWKREELEKQLGKVAVFFQRQPRTSEHMSWWFNKRNRFVDYAGALAINLAGYKAGWEPVRIHQTTEFVDVWFNCLLYENYAAMSELATRLGKDEDAAMFGSLSADLETAIKAKHYFAQARGGKGAFYSTYNGQPQYRDTIGNLASSLLRNLEERPLQSNVSLMDEAFNPPFPLPSVAMDDIANWDPYYEEEDRHWRTPTWPVANRLVRRAMIHHSGRIDAISADLRLASREWADRLHLSNLGMVAVTGGYAEHHNPITGMGQRMHKTRGHVFGIPDPDPSELLVA